MNDKGTLNIKKYYIKILQKIKASSHSLLGGFNLNLITIGEQDAHHMKQLR
jgi:hypothetical protein